MWNVRASCTIWSACSLSTIPCGRAQICSVRAPPDTAYDDGRFVLLLLLDGTLPVPFRGQVYHIPVHVWIPRAYPAEAPIVYVTPTQNMVVCRGSCVGPDGRVRLPYMDAWERKPEVRHPTHARPCLSPSCSVSARLSFIWSHPSWPSALSRQRPRSHPMPREHLRGLPRRAPR